MGHSALTPLWDLVKSIPPGHAASYGAVGRALPNPVSGLIVGRWMAQTPDDVPWWRVLGANGEIKVGKRDPRLGNEQRRRLEEEGAVFEGDRLAPAFFIEL